MNRSRALLALGLLAAGCAVGEEGAANPDEGAPAAVVVEPDGALDTLSPGIPADTTPRPSPPVVSAPAPPTSTDDRLRDSVRQGPLIELPTVADTAENHAGH